MNWIKEGELPGEIRIKRGGCWKRLSVLDVESMAVLGPGSRDRGIGFGREAMLQAEAKGDLVPRGRGWKKR